MAKKLIGNTALALLEIVEERKEQGGVDVIGIPTGLHYIDLWTGGLQKDSLIILAADSGMGKSAVATTVAIHVARQNKVVLYNSLEMGAGPLTARILSSMTEIPKGRIVRGKISDDELKRLKRAADELRSIPLLIDDKSMSSKTLVEEALTYADEKAAVDLVVVDYLNLLTDSGDNEQKRVNDISRTLRNLARPDQLDCPVMALTQLNKAVGTRENKRPSKNDIRDSYGPVQDAEYVLLCYRPQYYEPQQEQIEEDAELIIAKNREGMLGTTPATFIGARSLWLQPAPDAPRDPNPVSPKPSAPAQAGKKPSLKEQVQQRRTNAA